MTIELTPTIEAEMHLLSLCIQGYGKDTLSDVLATGVTEADFLHPSNAAMFLAILEAEKAGEVQNGRVVGRSVRTRLQANHLGIHYDWVKDNGAVAQNATAYAEAVMRFARLRQAQRRVSLLASTIEATDVHDDLAVHTRIVQEIGDLLTMQAPRKGPRQVGAILNDELFPEMERRQREYESRKALPGCPTGVTVLDKYLVGGFKPGAMYTIAARTGVGKTTLGINFAYQAAKSGHSAVFFTVEMEAREIAAKMLAMASGVRSDLIEVGAIGGVGGVLEETKIGFQKMPLFVDDSFCGAMEAVASTVRQMRRQGKIDVAYLDYLQLLSVGSKWKTEYERVTEVSTFIKRLALECHIPIVCLAQLNRAAANDAEPDMHHLKGSGQIEQDSNAVLVVFRERDDVYLKITKNRGGRTSDRIPLSIDFQTSKVSDTSVMYPESM